MKTISYYIGEFILAILIILLAGLMLLGNTIFKEDFMVKEIEKSNFISELYKTTEEEFSYYILQSGLSEEVVTGLISESEIKEVFLNYLHDFYEGNTLEIPTDQIKTKLEDNIIAYLNRNNLTVSDEASLDMFVEEIMNTYKQNMENSFLLGKVQTPFVKIKNLLPTITIMLSITIILLGLLLKFGTQRNVLGIPLFTSTFVNGTLYIYLLNSLDMQNFYVYNASFSNLMKSIQTSIYSNIIMIIISCAVLGLLSTGISSIHTKKGKKKIKTNA